AAKRVHRSHSKHEEAAFEAPGGKQRWDNAASGRWRHPHTLEDPAAPAPRSTCPPNDSGESNGAFCPLRATHPAATRTSESTGFSESRKGNPGRSEPLDHAEGHCLLVRPGVEPPAALYSLLGGVCAGQVGRWS